MDAKNKTRLATNLKIPGESFNRKAGVLVVKKETFAEIQEYRLHAKRCRELAAAVAGFEKKQLEKAAEEAERRANEAEARLRDGD